MCITPVGALEDVPDDLSPIGRGIASFEEIRKRAGLTDEDIARREPAVKPSGS